MVVAVYAAAPITSAALSMPFVVAAVRVPVVAMTAVWSIVVTAVRAVTVASFVVVSVFVGVSPATSKSHGAEEGDDDEKEDGFEVHLM